METFVVIGLGRFGSAVAEELSDLGHQVLAIDTDQNAVQKMADRVTKAVAADARDLDVLRKLGVDDFDRAVVAVGSDLGASALITMNLKTLGVPFILCKAHDDTYREILEKLGADRVIIPEREMADKLAKGLTTAGVMEYIELSSEYGIVEMTPPAEWLGKTIRALELRTRYGANIIAQRRGEDLRIPPDIDTPLDDSCVLVVLGSSKALEKLEKLEK